jgi:hypothetical protein
VRGVEVVFDVLTGKAGGVENLSASRSFALMLLDNALRRAMDLLPGPWDDPARRAEAQRLYEKYQASALTQALAAEGRWYSGPDWMRQHVGRFVTSSALVERRNALGEAELERREVEIEQEFGGVLYTDQYHRWQPRRWERCHSYTLRVVVAEPRWAEHLEPGLEFPTTAYDAWYEG